VITFYLSKFCTNRKTIVKFSVWTWKPLMTRFYCSSPGGSRQHIFTWRGLFAEEQKGSKYCHPRLLFCACVCMCVCVCLCVCVLMCVLFVSFTCHRWAFYIRILQTKTL
jgi:hypothetical protein